MKLYVVLLIVMLTSITNAQGIKGNMLTATLDGSRLIEDPKEYDSGMDLTLTMIMLRQYRVRPLIKVELFPNLQYYKTSIGAEYALPIDNRNGLLLELVGGLEAGMISRSTSDYEAYFGYVTYGVNWDVRLFEPFERFPIIFSSNGQYRSDFDIYGTEPDWVWSLSLGLGFTF